MIYGDIHRFLLRSIASRGVVTLREAEELMNRHTENFEESIKDVVRIINTEINPFQQTIKITKDELNDEEVMIFLSLGFDDATKSQNVFSATELEFFRILLEEIMLTETRQISSIYAMNLVSKMKSSFTKSGAQKLLKTWCQMRYLDRTNNEYALGVRAVYEFESYVQQNMPDAIEKCSLCKQIVFRGCNCPACGLAVHTHCLNKYLEKVLKWPCCKTDYRGSQVETTNHTQSLLQSQIIEDEPMSAIYDTLVEPEREEEGDLSQRTTAGVSQGVTRKRKRRN